MPADLSDAVRAAQAGDEDAFRLLYREVQPGLLRYLTALVGSDAEDVASETWFHISRDLRSFEGGPAFRAWAATIARNRALDHLRHHRRRPAQPVPAATLIGLPGTDDTAERAGEQIATDAAIALIAALPPTEAEAVLLRTVVGLDAKAAGRVLGKRAGAVRIAAHRGLRRLARMLEQTGPPGATPSAAQVAPAREAMRTGGSGERAAPTDRTAVTERAMTGDALAADQLSPAERYGPTEPLGPTEQLGSTEQLGPIERLGPTEQRASAIAGQPGGNASTEHDRQLGYADQAPRPGGRAERAGPGQQTGQDDRAGSGPVRAGFGRLAVAGLVNNPRVAWINRTSTPRGWDGRG